MINALNNGVNNVEVARKFRWSKHRRCRNTGSEGIIPEHILLHRDNPLNQHQR